MKQRKTHYNDLLEEFSVYSEIELSFKEQTFENADILRSLETLMTQGTVPTAFMSER